MSAATAAEPCAPAASAPCAALTIAQSHAQVSVLFADIVGFTTLVSTMTAQAAMDMLNDLYSRLDALSQRCGVYKIETVGDCYVAASGLQQVGVGAGSTGVLKSQTEARVRVLRCRSVCSAKGSFASLCGALCLKLVLATLCLPVALCRRTPSMRCTS